MSRRRLLGVGMTSPRTRERMVARLRREGIRDERVLEVMGRLPRHLFVDEALASRAYEDTALPIGHGQTLSRPYTVARMTELVLEHAPRRVLEIGTGSGYQAAVLACLVEEVCTIERLLPLLRAARGRWRELGLHNIRARHGDGARGWPARAPFDAVLLTAAPAEPPAALLEQLAPDGCLVGPLAGRGGAQALTVLRREDGRWTAETVEPASFVPWRGGVA